MPSPDSGPPATPMCPLSSPCPPSGAPARQPSVSRLPGLGSHASELGVLQPPLLPPAQQLVLPWKPQASTGPPTCSGPPLATSALRQILSLKCKCIYDYHKWGAGGGRAPMAGWGQGRHGCLAPLGREGPRGHTRHLRESPLRAPSPGWDLVGGHGDTGPWETPTRPPRSWPELLVRHRSEWRSGLAPSTLPLLLGSPCLPLPLPGCVWGGVLPCPCSSQSLCLLLSFCSESLSVSPSVSESLFFCLSVSIPFSLKNKTSQRPRACPLSEDCILPILPRPPTLPHSQSPGPGWTIPWSQRGTQHTVPEASGCLPSQPLPTQHHLGGP